MVCCPSGGMGGMTTCWDACVPSSLDPTLCVVSVNHTHERGTEMRKTHFFASTEEAYSRTQTDPEINDGDILVIKNEKVVGVLVQAWPVAVTLAHGEFHTLADHVTWGEFEGGKYLDSAHEAMRVAQS